jgi:hypothetical protein
MARAAVTARRAALIGHEITLRHCAGREDISTLE